MVQALPPTPFVVYHNDLKKSMEERYKNEKFNYWRV